MNEKGFDFLDFSFIITKRYNNLDALIRIGVVNKDETKIKFLDNYETANITHSMNRKLHCDWGIIKLDNKEYVIRSFKSLKYVPHEDTQIGKLVNEINKYNNSKKLLTLEKVRKFEKNWNDRTHKLHEKEDFLEF